MPKSFLASLKSSRQNRLCCVHSNWSTFRCGMNEHSMPAPHANFFVTANFPASRRAEPCDTLSAFADSDAALCVRPRSEVMGATSLYGRGDLVHRDRL